MSKNIGLNILVWFSNPLNIAYTRRGIQEVVGSGIQGFHIVGFPDLFDIFYTKLKTFTFSDFRQTLEKGKFGLRFAKNGLGFSEIAISNFDKFVPVIQNAQRGAFNG